MPEKTRKKTAPRKKPGAERNTAQGFGAGLLREIECVTSERFDLDRFLNRVMDLVTERTQAESATLFLLDESGDFLDFRVVKGPMARKLRGKKISKTEGIAGKVMKSGRPHVATDVTSDKSWSPRLSEEIGYRTANLLAVPLKMGGKTQGVIEVINKKGKKAFGSGDLELLGTLASQSAIAIRNAQLYLESRIRASQFAALSHLSGILNSSLDQKTVRKRAMEAAVKLLECETGSLYLIDHDRNELYFEVALGDKGDMFKEIRLKMGEGIAGWVAQEGKSDLVADTATDPRWASKVDKKSTFQTRNMVTVPVKAKGRTIGVLQAINKLRNRKFTVIDQGLLESLADQVAIALENARLYESQKAMFKETAKALATAIEKRDPYTGGHTQRVRDFSMAAAKYMGLTAEQMEWLELAAILHDAGKIGVDDQVLRKPGRLTDEEFDQMKKHPMYGFEILQHVKELTPAVPGMRYHHERFDGRGYPEGLKDGDIPLIARIITVADTWDAMTSDRPYRAGLPDQTANEELVRFSGVQFDPEVVKAFLEAYQKGEIKSQRTEREKNPPGGDAAV